MYEQLFFMIDGKELILDKILVEFNETPIFFVCKSEQTYFISLCTDIDNEKYLVAKISLSNLSKMLRGKMTMRDLILQVQSFWYITAGEDVSMDIVIQKDIELIPLDELPYEGEYLVLATNDLKKYADDIDAIIYSEETWENMTLQVCYECCNESLEMINEHYDIVLKNIYESVIENVRINYLKSFCDMITYNKEICSSKIKLNDEITKINVKIDNNDNWTWAA